MTEDQERGANEGMVPFAERVVTDYSKLSPEYLDYLQAKMDETARTRKGMSEYQIERLAAVVCGDRDTANCRHAWNQAHPDDPVTEEEQRAFEDRVQPEQ